MDLYNLSAEAAAEAVRSKRITARELTEAYLSRCTAVNSSINSFIHIFEDTALKQAGAVDEAIKRGEKELPLAGVPLAVKDDLCCRDAPTTCGAAALRNFRPPYSAGAVQKLVDAGAVIVGKTNLDEFGLGSTTATSLAGHTANPWNRDKVAGDGAAAAVASRQCLLALSSDSGGALRMGASYCGLFGLRPTTGLVSRYGLNTFASSFARVGLVAGNAGDLSLALPLISGYDPRDAATAAVKDGLPGQENGLAAEGLKVGCPAAVFNLLDDKIQSALDKAKENFAVLGVQFVDIELPLFQEALQAYYVVAMAETSSNFSRFDGIRFGTAFQGQDLEEWYCQTRGQTFGAEGKRRSVIGTYLLSKNSYDRYYRQALKVWNLFRQGFHAALENCDLIMLPVAGVPADARKVKEFIEAYREDLFCAPVSLSGLPALAVPAGKVDGLPVGMQLVGRPFSERTLLSLASRAVQGSEFPPAALS